MRRWRRFLLATLALPLLVLLDASPDPRAKPSSDPAERRYDAVVLVLQWVLRIYLIGCMVVFFWRGPGPGWPRAGFGPVADTVLMIHEWLAVTIIGTFGALLVLGAVVGSFQLAFLLCLGRRTTAIVVAETSPCHGPQFRFTDPEGQTHLVSEALARFGGSYDPGQQVPLIYLPGRPQTFMIDRFRDKWAPPLLLFTLGLLILTPCMAFVFFRPAG
jgi:hypothetical protein